MCRSVWVSAGRGGARTPRPLRGGCPPVGACVYGGLGGEGGVGPGPVLSLPGTPSPRRARRPSPLSGGERGAGMGAPPAEGPLPSPGSPPSVLPPAQGLPAGQGRQRLRPQPAAGPGMPPPPQPGSAGAAAAPCPQQPGRAGGGSWRAPSPLLRPLPWLRGRRGAAGCGRLLRGGWQPPP